MLAVMTDGTEFYPTHTHTNTLTSTRTYTQTHAHTLSHSFILQPKDCAIVCRLMPCGVLTKHSFCWAPASLVPIFLSVSHLPLPFFSIFSYSKVPLGAGPKAQHIVGYHLIPRLCGGVCVRTRWRLPGQRRTQHAHFCFLLPYSPDTASPDEGS